MTIRMSIQGRNLLLEGIAGLFSLADTLDCGQAFRWRQTAAGWEGVAGGKWLQLDDCGDSIVLRGAADDCDFWRRYFDLDRDYAAIQRVICSDPVLARAVDFAPGIRILRQQPWETLCTFILSANNNIRRIKGIIQRLCEGWGEPLGNGAFTFPAPERLALLSVDDLAPIRSGYRAKFLLDAARRVSSGALDLAQVEQMPLAKAQHALCQVLGVGPKVAQCILLYGYGRIDCVPMDVWMKRVIARFYPNGFPANVLPYAGIAQQYLFHYARCTKLEFDAAQACAAAPGG